MKGMMGECPDDYPLFAAARYMNVAPWDLIEHSVYYTDRALLFMTAEAQAQEILSKHS
jgi:hypothetical protein